MDIFNEKFDIIIQGGQSNAEGCGQGPVEKEYLPSPNVLYLDAPKKVQLIQVDGEPKLDIQYFDQPFVIEPANIRFSEDNQPIGDFSLSFAEKYVENGFLAQDRKLLIIRAGIGGSGFQKGHWGMQDPVYLKMMEMVTYALSLNAENKIVGFFFQQGEHDAFEKNTPENYHSQVNKMLLSVREQFGEHIPFISADFVHDWKGKNIEICEPIVDVLRSLAVEHKNAAFVETNGLLSNDQALKNGDDIHFSREALRLLGIRYFEKWKTLINE